MRKSDFYGVDVPELGDRADITVVSQAIIDGENNQSGRIEHLEATNSGTTLILSSETRADKLIKYYNGLSIQFVSPVNITAGNSYKIKIDNLAEQPYSNKTDIKAGDIVQAYYGASGFVSSNTPIPRSSSTSSSSEVTVATSLAVKNANDNANTRALKTVQVVAGKGLIGGGALNGNVTLSVVSANDAILVNEDNIQLNPVNDLTTGGAYRALSGQMGVELKKHVDEKQNKTDNGLKTDSKEIAGAINELYDTKFKSNGIQEIYNLEEVPWNANTGLYAGLYPTAAALVYHMFGAGISAGAAQLAFFYGNGPTNGMIAYKVARDSNGFEGRKFTSIYTTDFKPTPNEIGAYTKYEVDNLINANAVTSVRLGTVIPRAIWKSTESASELYGYVTVAVANHNADEVPDIEYRRPLQIYKNGQWITVSAI